MDFDWWIHAIFMMGQWWSECDFFCFVVCFQIELGSQRNADGCGSCAFRVDGVIMQVIFDDGFANSARERLDFN